jgi:hypothetical protein
VNERDTRDIVVALEARFETFLEHYDNDRKKLGEVHTAFVQMQGAGKLVGQGSRFVAHGVSGLVGFVSAWLSMRFPWLAPMRGP